MPDMVLPSREDLLRLCAAAAPEPWYPKKYVEESGAPRRELDVLLNELRLGGLLRLADWQKYSGQGYLLTPLGAEVLKSPSSLAQLRNGVQKLSIAKSVATPEAPAKKKSLTRYEVAESARRAIYEPTRPRVMPVLLALNLIAFIVSLVVALRMGVPFAKFAQVGDAVSMHKLGAVTTVDLVHGEWWRLLTCCFLHFGLLHLLMNMLALYALGVVESLYGSVRYLIIYLASGIGGSCVAMVWNPSAAIANLQAGGHGPVLAGASCAIWGLLTALVAWLFINRSYLNPDHVSAWFRRIGMVVVLNVFVSFIPGISAAGHFGGGAVGFIVATLLLVERFAPQPRRTVALLLLLLLPLLSYKAVTYAMENGPGWQQLKTLDELRLQQAKAQDEMRLRLAEVNRFEHEVVSAVDKANGAFIDVEPIAYSITDTRPEDRRADPRGRKLKTDLQTTGELVESAMTKLGDKPYADERLEAARTAGLNYMRLVSEQIKRFEQLMDLGMPWKIKVRRSSAIDIGKARAAWIEKRNQL
jgi:rhomboid protease GluP